MHSPPAVVFTIPAYTVSILEVNKLYSCNLHLVLEKSIDLYLRSNYEHQLLELNYTLQQNNRDVAASAVFAPKSLAGIPK